jgi:hypothetical protein
MSISYIEFFASICLTLALLMTAIAQTDTVRNAPNGTFGVDVTALVLALIGLGIISFKALNVSG